MSKARKYGLFLLVAAIFLGCATAYQPAGAMGGYSDRRIDDNTVYVTFRGNGFTSPDTVHYYLLRRCADVTLKNGFDYFVIVSSDSKDVGDTNLYGAKTNNKYLDAATIKMYKGRKPAKMLQAYDAAQVSKNAYAQSP